MGILPMKWLKITMMSNQQTFATDEPEKHRTFKKSGKKPYVVEYKSKHNRSIMFGNWHKFGAYQTKEIAEQVIRQKSGDAWFEYRIKE